MNKRQEIEGPVKNLNRVFILPMVGIDYKRRLPSNFVNSYLTKEYEIMLAFDKTRDCDEIFYHFLDRTTTSNKNFKSHVEYDDEIIIGLQIPEIFKDDVDKFLKGAYSEFSEYYKRILCQYYGKTTIKENHAVTEYNVIYPEDFKRKQIAEYLSYDKSNVDYKLIKEVLDRPDLDKEMYKDISVLLERKNSEETLNNI